MYKIQIERGSGFMKKIANSCILGFTLWTVLTKKRGLPIGQIRPNFKIFNNFPCKFQIKRGRGSLLRKQLPTCVFGAPQFRPFWTNRGVYQSAQNEPILNFEFFQQFPVQNQNSMRVDSIKKLTSHVYRAVLVKHMPADRPKMGWIHFLIILNWKY